MAGGHGGDRDGDHGHDCRYGYVRDGDCDHGRVRVSTWSQARLSKEIVDGPARAVSIFRKMRSRFGDRRATNSRTTDPQERFPLPGSLSLASFLNPQRTDGPFLSSQN